MVEMVLESASSIINSVVVNAVLDLVVTVVLVVLLSSLLVLVLTNSVNSILLLVKNSILIKAVVGNKDDTEPTGYTSSIEGIRDLPVQPAFRRKCCVA